MAERATKRTRLMVDVTPELRRRIKLAAAQRDNSVRDYVVAILEAAVAGGEQSPMRGRRVTPEIMEQLARLRAQQARPFTIDSADLIHEARLERMADL